MSLWNDIAKLHYAAGGKLSPWLWPLLPLELGYRLGVFFRLQRWKQGWKKPFRASLPVISVGNLTTGGTGKTPIVIEIARGMVRAGKTVLILSRGYGATEPVDYGRALNPKTGDEAFLIQQEVPEAVVIVGRDRVQTLQRAVQDYRPDIVLLDDGFQHLRLFRDINIVLIDGERLVGNGHLLPAGPLREPLTELRRADLVMLTKNITHEGMRTVEGWLKQGGLNIQLLPVPFHATGLRMMEAPPTDPPEQPALFRHRPAIALSGIARPEDFERALKDAGFDLKRHFRFSDHHAYTATELARILAFAEGFAPKGHPRESKPPPLLLTTEKDLVKLRALIPEAWRRHVFTLRVQPALDGRWFHDEFLSQMPGYQRAGEGHAQSSRR